MAGWGAYLACSWTWCIGMFLPVMLLRDYGALSFVVFAVPNVLGAAFMGLVLARPGVSEAITTWHWPACAAFSRVTTCFQAFFLGWLVVGLNGPGSGASALFVPAVAASALLIPLLPSRARIGILKPSLAVLAASVVAGAAYLSGDVAAARLGATVQPPERLAYLAGVCIFGFALCPYLDLTFHRARRSLPGPHGSRAFILGFCVFFAGMILLTLLYAPGLIAAAEGRGLSPALLAAPIVLHMLVQLFFTMRLHTIEVRPAPRDEEAWRLVRHRLPWEALLGVTLGAAAALLPSQGGLSAGEIAYRAFMGFYGLYFPAYVWICMLPRRGAMGPVSRRTLMVYLFAVSSATLPFVMGFIERREIFLLPGLALVIAARAFVPAPRAHGAP